MTASSNCPRARWASASSDWLAENDPAKVDPVIEIAITPNRPDALGVRGIARDLAARGLGTLKPAPETACPGPSLPDPVTIDADTRTAAALRRAG
jgi:phenylalanyl-tRNA synthetase beta chain